MRTSRRARPHRTAFDSDPDQWVSPEDWHDYLPVASDSETIARIVRGDISYEGLPYHAPYTHYAPITNRRKPQGKPPNRERLELPRPPKLPPPLWPLEPEPLQPEPYRLYVDSPPLSSARNFVCELGQLKRMRVEAQAVVGITACGACRVRNLTAILATGLIGWNVDRKLWLFGTVCGNCERLGLFAWPDPRGYEPVTNA